MIIVESLEDFKEAVKKITARVRGTEKAPTKPVEDTSIPDSPLVEAIRKDFHRIDRDLGPIFSAIVQAIEGRYVDFKDDEEDDSGVEYTYPRYSAVVPLKECHDHDYPIGKAFIVTKKDSDGQAHEGIKSTPSDRFGNTHFGEWRYATDEEIDALFSTFAPAEADELLNT